MLTAIRHGLMEPPWWPKTAVVVLAGGRSSRMGRDKARIPNRADDARGTLLDHACALGEQFLVGLGYDQQSLFVSGEYPGYQCVSDRVLGRGPLGGMHAALAAIGEKRVGYEFVMFLPVDMPALRRETLQRLVRNIGEELAAYFYGFQFPALIRVSSEIEEVFRFQLESSDGDRTRVSVRETLRILKAHAIEPRREELSEFLNVNTPADLQAWQGRRSEYSV